MRNYINKEALVEFEKLAQIANLSEINEEFIFKKVNELDLKYAADNYYSFNIEGILGNLAYDIGSEKLIKFAIHRLKEKLRISNDEWTKDKFNYDLGTLILGKADLLNPYTSKFLNLLEAKDYDEARNFFNNVSGEHFAPAQTNQANILDKFGRNFEAILLYDKVLIRDSNFGMALGNKAKSLVYYYELSPYKSNFILEMARNLLVEALHDKDILEIGGQQAFNFFSWRLQSITFFLKENSNNQVANHNFPINSYEKFILENNLFLNFDFGLVQDKNSFEDSLFPAFVQRLEPQTNDNVRGRIFSDNVDNAIKVFNQIQEDYVSVRLLFYEWKTKDVSKYDKKVSWIYTFDFSRNSIKHGILKLILTSLYNILDKVARVVLTYFEIKKSSEDIYLHDLESPDFKKLIKKTENYQLLALHSLSKDFHEKRVYSKFQKLRNKITHNTIDIVEIPTNENSNYIIEDLCDDILELFLIVKSAILYTSIGINEETEKENQNKVLGQLPITFQDRIFR